MFERSVIQDVRRKTDIVALVGEYAPLKKMGTRWVCRCPFHEEKTPSFSVSPEVGLYFCFGCKASGDAIRFLEHLEGLTFPEALRRLAERAGVDLPETRDPAVIAEDRRRRSERDRILAVCEAAAAYYEAQLHPAARAPFSELARGALEERGITAETATRFRLGYAPARWDGLTAHLRERGYSPADAELAGLLVPSMRGHGGHGGNGGNGGGAWHDRFRHRLMFPIFDRAGKVVAFSGRILPESEDMPEGIVPAEGAAKYLNSPESPVFTKGENLYGLQAARLTMRQRASGVVVEGNFDVVQMHQHGFTETVAPLGTAFTPEQAQLLRRTVDRVTLVFDGDGAGRKAARASHAVCEKAGLSARVGVLPSKSDPDSYLRASGAAAMAHVLAASQGMVEWLIRDAAAQLTGSDAAVSHGGHGGHGGHGLGGAVVTTSDRVAAARQLAPVLASIRDRIEAREEIRRAASELVLGESAIEEAVRDHLRTLREDARAPLPTTRTASNRVGLSDLGRPGDVSDDAASKARRLGVEAVLFDPQLLASTACARLLEHLRPPFDAVVREAREQWMRGERLDGPAILEAVVGEGVPDEKATAVTAVRAWVAARLIPPDDPGVTERCGMALRDALARLEQCRVARETEAARIDAARRSANGDREGEALALEQRRAGRTITVGGTPGTPGTASKTTGATAASGTVVMGIGARGAPPGSRPN